MLRHCGRSTSSSRPLLLSPLHQLAAAFLPVEGSRCVSTTSLAQAWSRRGANSIAPAAQQPAASAIHFGDKNAPVFGADSAAGHESEKEEQGKKTAPLLWSRDSGNPKITAVPLSNRLPNASVKLERRRRRPKLISVELTENLNRKVQLLEAEGFFFAQWEPMLKKKAFLACSPEQLLASLKLLKPVAGENACKVLAVNVGILKAPIEHLETNLTLFQSYGVPNEVLVKLGTSCHSVLTAKPEDIQAKLHYLEEIGFTVAQRNRVLNCYPQFMRLPVETRIKPAVQFLRSKVMNDEKLLQQMCRRPQVFGLSPEKHLLPRFKLFEELGFTCIECWKAVINCTNSIESMLSLFKNSGFTHNGINKILQKQPQVLRQSTETLEVRLHHLTDIYERDLEEIVRLPSALSYSLENRVIPRLKILKEKNLDKEYSLASILPIKESLFRKRFRIPDSVALC